MNKLVSINKLVRLKIVNWLKNELIRLKIRECKGTLAKYNFKNILEMEKL